MSSPDAFGLLFVADERLLPSDDPERSRQRLIEARWSDEDQDAERQRVLDLLEVHGAALADRATVPAHLTASAMVVDSSCTRVLVMLHAKLGRWLQPGGHGDGDHELAGVALREATEETGIDGLAVAVPAIDIDIHEIPARNAEQTHLHLDLRFLVVAPLGAVVHKNHESEDLRWVTIDELRRLSDDVGLMRLARRGLDVYGSMLARDR